MRTLALTLLFLAYISNYMVSTGVVPEVQIDDADESEELGYYWREFNGRIPKDAFPGGTNTHGKPTYIGQVLHKDQLIPAKIDKERKKAYYEWGYTEFETTQNVKILCTRYPEQFEWVKTGNKLINNITDKHFVVGGYEAGVTILIGRKQLEDEIAVGKIVFTTTQSTLNTSKDGKGHQHADFEVLCYNPDLKIIKKEDDKKDNECDEITPSKFLDVRYGEGPDNSTTTEATEDGASVVINIYS